MSSNSKKFGLVVKPPATEKKDWSKGMAQLDKNGQIISSVQTKVANDKVESIGISLEDKTVACFTKDNGYINDKRILTTGDLTNEGDYLLERTNKDENGIYTKVIHKNRDNGLPIIIGELKKKEKGLYKIKLVNYYNNKGKFISCIGEHLIYDEEDRLVETQVLDVVCCKDVDIENKEDTNIEVAKDKTNGDLVIKISRKGGV